MVQILRAQKQPPTILTGSNIFYRSHLAEYDDEIIRELREIQLAQSELADRFNQYQINEISRGKLNTNLQEVPFIVVVTKTDLNDFDQFAVDELNIALQSYNGDNLYYPKVMETSALNLNGWSSLIYLIRHMYESVSGLERTNDIYW